MALFDKFIGNLVILLFVDCVNGFVVVPEWYPAFVAALISC